MGRPRAAALPRVVAARGGSEHAHQRALVTWARLMSRQALPELALLHAIPNGGWRLPVTAARMAAEGALAGVPDLFLPVARWGFHGLYLELKAPIVAGRGLASLSPPQRIFLDRVIAEGYLGAVAFSSADGERALAWYLAAAGRSDVVGRFAGPVLWRHGVRETSYLWGDPGTS